MAREIFVVGDHSRLVVRNLTEELKKNGFIIHNILANVDNIRCLPDNKNHVILCLSDDLDFDVLRYLVKMHKQDGWHLYTVGIMNMSIEQGEYFKKVPAVKFPSYTVNIPLFIDHMEKNDIEKKRILVVDDEPILLRSIKGWLGSDFEVSLVNCGESALEFLDLHPVDLVLLDYKMPTMDGPDVLKLIRNDDNKKNTPVMFLTAKNDRESILSVMAMKPEGYILKSRSPIEIRQAVVDFFVNRSISIEE